MRARSQTEGLRPGNNRRSPLAYAIGLALAAAPIVAGAQTAAPADEGGGLQEIVVTATRHEESLSKVPISVTALTQENLDVRGIKDILDVARFTPGVNVDNSGTGNIAIRGIASTGGAGTTGVYIDDTPIQMRALAFNPDEALPKAFDIDRIEVLRGPQGTLFGAGSEGGTVRYITTQPSLTKSSVYGRGEISTTKSGDPSYEAGVAAGGPLIDDRLGARATVWYRRDGGWIDLVNPTAQNPAGAVIDKRANHAETLLIRLAAVWAVSDQWTVTPGIYYQDRNQNANSRYWPLYSDSSSDRYVSGNPSQLREPDKFYLPSLKIRGDFGKVELISNTSYYHRENQAGYDGTLYNLGFYQTFPSFSFPFLPNTPFPLLNDSGIHLPASLAAYRSPATVDNGQQNFTQEIRLQSNDPGSPLTWTTGVFFNVNRQTYLEQIHDPMLDTFWFTMTGHHYTDIFTDANGNPTPYDPRFPQDSYFLQTHAKDKQLAVYGEASYAMTEQWKVTAGLRVSRMEFSFESLTGGPQLFSIPLSNSSDKKETSTTPKLGISYQADPQNLYYATYAKGFRPGGGNNPLPLQACLPDFTAFGIKKSPDTYNSDTVDSYEIGAKNNLNNRVKVASSLYYIRWHNIQQTVIPPVCQISFIDNLGEAVAKGGDVQLEVGLSGGFSAQLSAGYTSARYSADSRFPPVAGQPPTRPIAASGDAITGQSTQPTPPVTASVGLEYAFAAHDHESFVRVDYEYQGAPKWASPSQDGNRFVPPPGKTGTAQFDAANYSLSSTSFMSLRGGTSFGRWSVAAFVDNLLDSHTVTNYDWTINPGTGDRRLQRQITFRPRTIGLTFTYRN